MSARVRKGYGSVCGRDVHFRTAGSGPPVILMHDSPRSSALHLPLMSVLSGHFTVIAPDTPGNGASTPLIGDGPFQVADFADALAAFMDTLGVRRAGIYGFHTSSKFLLDFTIRYRERVSVAIMDGLSLPEGGPDPACIAAAGPDGGKLHQRFIDVMTHMPNYGDALLAGLDEDARPLMAALPVPALVTTRADDPRYGFAPVAAELSNKVELAERPTCDAARAALFRQFLDRP